MISKFRFVLCEVGGSETVIYTKAPENVAFIDLRNWMVFGRGGVEGGNTLA